MYTKAKLVKMISSINSVHTLSKEKIMAIIRGCGAMRTHHENCVLPHAELTAKPYSDEHINLIEVAFNYPNIWEIFSVQLFKKIKSLGIDIQGVDRVVGSAYLPMPLSFLVANLLAVKWGFTQQSVLVHEYETMIWKGPKILSGERILQIEDYISDLRTILQVRKAIKKVSPKSVFLPTIRCIVHQPQKLPVFYKDENENISIFSLVELELAGKK